MRDRLNKRITSMPDLGFVPEAYLVEGAMTDPVTFGRRNQDQIKRLIETANYQLLTWEEAKPRIITAINDQDPLVRLWGLVAATSFGTEAKEIASDVEKRLVDLEPLVVIRAVEFLALLRSKGEMSLKDPLPFLYRSLQRSVSEAEALRVLNTAVFLRDHCGTEGRDRLKVNPRELQSLPRIGKSRWFKGRIEYLSKRP
jgi:uncharacterized sulfatase